MKKTKILIFEDSSAIAKILRHILEENNYDIIGIYTNAVDGVKSLENQIPDLILMDIFIKGNIDGIVTARIIKNKYKIPIIFLTANSDKAIFEKAKLSGADGFLIKDNNLNYNLIFQLEFALNKQIQERKVSESEEKFRYIAENTFDGIISLNSDKSFKYVSPAYLKLLNCSNINELGNNYYDILSQVHDDFKEKIINQFEEAINQNYENLIYHYLIYNKKNNLIWVEDVFHFDYDANKKFIGAVIISRDITEQKETQLKLEVLNSEKNNILHIVAHDLKNPIASILMNLELVTTYFDKITKEDLIAKLNQLSKTTNFMKDIVMKLIDKELIENAKLTIKKVEFLPSEVIIESLNQFETQSNKKNITIHFDNDLSNSTLFTDKNIFREIIDNYISNALKYSPFNSNIWIKLDIIDKMLYLSVRDEGPGIAKEELGKLFLKFSKLSSTTTDKEDSSGIGLYSVKRGAESIGGEVYCKSVFGQGAEFVLKLSLI